MPYRIPKKTFFTKGYNFSIPGKKLDYADYPVNFELFLRDILNLDILPNEDLDFVKAKTKEAAISSYRTYNNNVALNLSNYELIALQNLSEKRLDHSEI